MAEVRHHYVGKVESDEERERQAKRDRLDAQWKQARIDAELARQKVHAAKLLEMKGELIPRQLVQKQSAFLVLSIRARLLSIPEQHADELLGISDRLEMVQRLDSIARSTLETLADMPERVTDPDWMKKVDELDGNEAKRRPRRAAK